MLHAVILVLFTALARKLGFRDLTPEEEAELPGYFVKAERVRRRVQDIAGLIILAVVVTFALLAR